jgi:drug/metabolite transporter (DMT)-like permease
MHSSTLIGIAAALAAALLGSAWQLLTRHGVTTTLGPIDIALLRYGIPALVLLPVLRRVGLRPRSVSWLRLACLVAGGGLPFGLLVLAGAQFAPAAHMGIFMAGTTPVFAALAGLLLLGERVQGARWVGFAIIASGVAWLGLSQFSMESSAWRGDLLFVLASLVWAGYTIAFRGSGLSPFEGAAIINAWSLLALLFLLPWTGLPHLMTAPWQDVAVQALGQGVLAGLLGLPAYMVAVKHLGSTRAALSSALVPPLTALGAGLLLREPTGVAVWGASLVVACGVALASGVSIAHGWKAITRSWTVGRRALDTDGGHNRSD